MPDHHRRNRVLRLIAVAIAVIGGIVALGRLSPALSALTRSGAVVVAVAFTVGIWHASRARSHGDRRHGDRRQI